jgi:IS1 family transposase
LGDRCDSDCQKLINRIDDGKCIFVTDDWAGFKRLLPQDRHFTGKDLTFPIEASNSDIGHNLARFHRRSKVSSRNKEMVHASLLLFYHLQSPESLASFLAPLKSSFG